MNNFYLRKASISDNKILTSFKLDTIFENIENSINENEKKKIISYVKKSTKKHLNDYKIIMIDNNIIGSLLIYPYNDGVILDEIYLKREFHHQGIGTTIMNNIINNNSKIYLWVHKNNHQALALYKKLHFKIIEEDDYRYQMLYK